MDYRAEELRRASTVMFEIAHRHVFQERVGEIIPPRDGAVLRRLADLLEPMTDLAVIRHLTCEITPMEANHLVYAGGGSTGRVINDLLDDQKPKAVPVSYNHVYGPFVAATIREHLEYEEWCDADFERFRQQSIREALAQQAAERAAAGFPRLADAAGGAA